jgi:hypothetical protein
MWEWQTDAETPRRNHGAQANTSYAGHLALAIGRAYRMSFLWVISCKPSLLQIILDTLILYHDKASVYAFDLDD